MVYLPTLPVFDFCLHPSSSTLLHSTRLSSLSFTPPTYPHLFTCSRLFTYSYHTFPSRSLFFDPILSSTPPFYRLIPHIVPSPSRHRPSRSMPRARLHNARLNTGRRPPYSYPSSFLVIFSRWWNYSRCPLLALGLHVVPYFFLSRLSLAS